MLAPIVAIGLAALGLVLGSSHWLSDRLRTDDAGIEALFDLSARAVVLKDTIVVVADRRQTAIATGNAVRLSAEDLLRAIASEQVQITGLAAQTPLAKAVAALDKDVDHWRQAQASLFDPAIDTTDAVAELAAMEVRITDDVLELSAQARTLATDIVKAQRATYVVTLTWVCAGLLGCAALAGWHLMRNGTRAEARVLDLPRQLERAVFDSDTSLEPQGWPDDPAARLAAGLAGFVEKVRTKLRDNEKVERMAFTDSLTGLPNRRGLLAFLDKLADNDEVWEGDNRVGIIHLDLDHFKAINDTLGHDAGDMVLREATRRMSTAIRDSDILARLGGDEFLIVTTGVETENDLEIIADRLLAQFETPIMYYRRACDIGVSMGVVLAGQRGRVRDPKRLLINSDMALARAKAEGRGRYSIFTSAMAAEARLRNERSIALADALHCDAFLPWFQPMVNRMTDQVVGLEVLARWHDPERGILMPQDFLEDAEAGLMMEEIGLQVLTRALDAIGSWRNRGLDVPQVHLNMSWTQLLSSSFVDRLSWALDEANILPEYIAMEVDEAHCSSRGQEVAFANLGRMRKMGAQVVLDNFGADLAALAVVAPTGARVIKCSPDPIERLLGERAQAERIEVLSALQAAAVALDLRITAKDVETELQSEVLLQSGIVIQQGDFIAQVMDSEETEAFLAARRSVAMEEARKAS